MSAAPATLLTQLDATATPARTPGSRRGEGPEAKILVVPSDQVAGSSLARWLEERGYVAVVLGRADGSEDDLVEAIRRRAVDHVARPLEVGELAEELERALGPADPGDDPGARATDQGMIISLARELSARVDDDTLELPTVDPRLGRIRRVTENPFCGVSEVVGIVGDDPALVAAILRSANCAYLNPGARINNVREACVRLGNSRVATLTMEALARNAFHAQQEPYRSIAARQWQNAMASARLAEGVARKVFRGPCGGALRSSLPHLDDLYLAALLHNIGELLLVYLIADLSGSETSGQAQPNLGPTLERLHQAFGRRLATHWKLPPIVVRLAAHHHVPARTPEPAGEKAIREIVLASWTLALRAGLTYMPEHDAADPAPHIAALGLEEGALDELVTQVVSSLKDLA